MLAELRALIDREFDRLCQQTVSAWHNSQADNMESRSQPEGILLQYLEILIKSDRLSVLHLWKKVFNGFSCDIDKVAKRFIIVG